MLWNIRLPLVPLSSMKKQTQYSYVQSASDHGESSVVFKPNKAEAHPGLARSHLKLQGH
jgi:hypothetical protein